MKSLNLEQCLGIVYDYAIHVEQYLKSSAQSFSLPP